jgi:peptidoglycan/LPS O-acetylase OafA/YrhL
MSMEDLRQQGVLLPEDEWGKHKLKTTVPQRTLAVLLLAAVAGLVAAYLGDGDLLTWIGMAAFLVLLFVVTAVVDRSVNRQRRRVREERGGG